MFQNAIEQNKAVVDACYQAGVRGDLPSFAPYLDEDFHFTAPNYLPWGGPHEGAAFFRNVLDTLPDVADFSRFGYELPVALG